MSFPNKQNSAAGAIPVWAAPAPTGATGSTVVSATQTVGAASAQILAAGVVANWVSIQNTHASNSLYVSATNPATTADFKIAAGASISLPFGVANALYGIGSGAGTTVAIIYA